MFRRIAILIIASACLAGCTMAPSFGRPESPVSATLAHRPVLQGCYGETCRQDGGRHTLAGVFCRPSTATADRSGLGQYPI